MSPLANGSRGGRPRKKPIAAGEKVQIGVRITPQMRKQLEKAIATNGRSLTQEAEHRLERSFSDEGRGGSLKQGVFISSTELSRRYLDPFKARHYYRFKKDPRWPAAVIDNGGTQVYRRRDIDRFLERIADEGFDFNGEGVDA